MMAQTWMISTAWQPAAEEAWRTLLYLPISMSRGLATCSKPRMTTCPQTRIITRILVRWLRQCQSTTLRFLTSRKKWTITQFNGHWILVQTQEHTRAHTPAADRGLRHLQSFRNIDEKLTGNRLLRATVSLVRQLLPVEMPSLGRIAACESIHQPENPATQSSRDHMT